MTSLNYFQSSHESEVFTILVWHLEDVKLWWHTNFCHPQIIMSTRKTVQDGQIQSLINFSNQNGNSKTL